jgi:S1-C subfamily serine protease
MNPSERKSRFRLPIILGVNTVFILLLGGSSFEFFKNQQGLLISQETSIAELSHELQELKHHQKNQIEISADQQDRLVSNMKFSRVFEQHRLELSRQRQAAVAEAEQNREEWLNAVQELTSRQDREGERVDAQFARVMDDSKSQRKEIDQIVNQTTFHHERALHASVRVNAKSEVGSGVVIFNGRRGSRERLETYILTAYHVVKDNLSTSSSLEQPIEIDFYKAGLKIQTARARVVESDAQQDLALLRVTSEIIALPALLAQRKTLNNVHMFSKVLTIGCPLGYSPMPTHGEITSTSKTFDDQEFWMINAPTIFGNSGGGVFDAKSGALLGVLIRIAAYKNVIDVAVPHLGIVTPIEHVKKWLSTSTHSFILNPRKTKKSNAPISLEAGRKKE